MNANTSRCILVFAAASALAASAARADGDDEDVRETWNRGVEFLRAGDCTNALETLRPLMSTRSHGARAAEAVAKLEYDEAVSPDCKDPLARMEKAAAAAQTALRSSPDDPRLARNLSRAASPLAAMREAKHVNDVVAAAKDKNPASLSKEAAVSLRETMKALGAARTDDAAGTIARFDAFAEKAAKASDAAIAVKALAQTAQAAQPAQGGRDDGLTARADTALEAARTASRLLAEMDDDAKYALAEAEGEFTALYKAFVDPPAAIAEDLECQTNAWLDVAEECGRGWQNEALDYTRAFAAKFPQWAASFEAQQQAQGGTNAVPFTAEAKSEIAALCARLEELQKACCETPDPPMQEECIGIIERIIELLPKPPPRQGGGGESKDKQDDSRQGGDGQDQKNDNNGKNGDDGNDGANRDDGEDPGKAPQDEGEDGGDRKEDGKGEGESGDEEANGAEGRDDDAARAMEGLLKKAQERSDEHEAEKKARARRVRLPPDERDW